MKNPLCDNCTSLMSSSGLAKAASPGGFVHSSDLFTPPRYPYLWDVEKFSCPLCKLCFSLRNKSRQLCPQHVPSEGFKIFWDNNTKQLTLRISLDLRFSPRHYVGCSQSLCILADQGMFRAVDQMQSVSDMSLILQMSAFPLNTEFGLFSVIWLAKGPCLLQKLCSICVSKDTRDVMLEFVIHHHCQQGCLI